MRSDDCVGGQRVCRDHVGAPAPVHPEPLLRIFAHPALDDGGHHCHGAAHVDLAGGIARQVERRCQLDAEAAVRQADDAHPVDGALEAPGELAEDRIGQRGAAEEGHADVCELLAASGAQLDRPKRNGHTPLLGAVVRQQEKAVEVLALRWGEHAAPLREMPAGIDAIYELYMVKDGSGRASLALCEGNTRSLAALKAMIERECPPPPRLPELFSRSKQNGGVLDTLVSGISSGISSMFGARR